MPWKFSICFSLAPAALEKHWEVSIGFGWDRDGIFSASPEAHTSHLELHLHAHRIQADCLGLHLWADLMGSPHACKWGSLSRSLAPERPRAGFSWNLLPRQFQTRRHNKEFLFPCSCACQEDTTQLGFPDWGNLFKRGLFEKREGIQGLILIPANREKRMLVSQLSECKN